MARTIHPHPAFQAISDAYDAAVKAAHDAFDRWAAMAEANDPDAESLWPTVMDADARARRCYLALYHTKVGQPVPQSC